MLDWPYIVPWIFAVAAIAIAGFAYWTSGWEDDHQGAMDTNTNRNVRDLAEQRQRIDRLEARLSGLNSKPEVKPAGSAHGASSVPQGDQRGSSHEARQYTGQGNHELAPDPRQHGSQQSARMAPASNDYMDRLKRGDQRHAPAIQPHGGQDRDTNHGYYAGVAANPHVPTYDAYSPARLAPVVDPATELMKSWQAAFQSAGQEMVLEHRKRLEGPWAEVVQLSGSNIWAFQHASGAWYVMHKLGVKLDDSFGDAFFEQSAQGTYVATVLRPAVVRSAKSAEFRDMRSDLHEDWRRTANLNRGTVACSDTLGAG